MTKTLRLLPVALLAALALTGCGPKRIAVKPDFFSAASVKVGVAVAPLPKGGAHKVGAQGLLDMAINAGMAGDLAKHLESFDASGFEVVREGFVAELGRRKMTAKAIPGAFDLATFPEWKAEGDAIDRDLRAFGKQEGLDMLVVLSVRRLGSIRSYYGFIPLGAPKGFVEVTGQMIDLRTNALVWQMTSEEAASSVAVADPWDQAPDYPNLTAALRQALENGKAWLTREYFDASPAI